MKILVSIADDDASFGLKVLNSLSFVKDVKPMSDAAIKLWADLKESAREARLHKQGKIKLRDAKELLDEL